MFPSLLTCAVLLNESRGPQIENRRFAYKSRPDVEVLKGLDLIIPGGTTCGIVGTSGAGKSTVLSLLMQFYKPTSGRLLVDGQDLSLHDRCTTHKWVSDAHISLPFGYLPAPIACWPCGAHHSYRVL